VVVPCFNEQEVIAECFARLTSILDTLGDSWEIVFVDDGSRDNTPWLLRDFFTQHANVTVALLSRNFGHQHAVTAGLTLAHGEAVLVIDADLQDPPELIPQMVQLWREGYDVVYGVRESRAGETSFKLWTASLFYKLINLLSAHTIPENAGDFRLLGRKALNALLSMPERHRLLRAMSSWIGFRQYPLHYQRAPRHAGATKYSLARMLALALDGIVSFSAIPLRIVTVLGFLSAILACVGICYLLAVRLFTHEWVRGWATLWFGTLFLGGLQMICLGILGEYIGRIYTEIKQRPLFLLDELLRHDDRVIRDP
jgi:dolichol-phosphate mannosyltransferase